MSHPFSSPFFSTRALISGLALALSACASNVPLQRDQVARLSATSSAAEVQVALGKATEVRQFGFEAEGSRYLVREFRLQTGSTQQMTMVCTPNCMPIFVSVPVTTDFVLVSLVPAQSLLAWGTLEELSKSPDARIASLMPALKAQRQQLMAPK